MNKVHTRFLKSMIGQSLIIEWLDPTGYIQARLKDCKPSKCLTQGVLVKIEKRFVVIASSQYADDPTEQIVDATAITKGCVESIRML